ncbi:MAG: hypothetical protein RSB59_07015 [Clostridia bacterium]
MKNINEKKHTAKCATAKLVHKTSAPTKAPQQKAKLGNCVMTRDEYFKDRKNQTIKPEIEKERLYRRTIIAGINKEEELALQKVHTRDKPYYPNVPHDRKGRTYEYDILTLDDCEKPIKLKKGKFELGNSYEGVTIAQAEQMKEIACSINKKNYKRLKNFNKKQGAN